MYTSFFGLNEKPFSITPDPRYLFMSERHGEALAHLVYGVTESGGFIQLTGEVGTGKTTLVRSLLLNRLPTNADVAVVLNPQLSALEFLQTICEELGVRVPGDLSAKAMLDGLNRHLLDAHADGRRTILIVDEAQNLAADVLEEVRLLTNLETAKQKLLQIILIGQPELRDVLARSDLRQLAQRITGRYHLEPLTRDETAKYIEHRLKVAGALTEIFDAGGKREVFRLSEGVPRLINVICDRALLGAYSLESRQINRRLVRRAAAEVTGKSLTPAWMRWAVPVMAGAGAVVLLGGVWSVLDKAPPGPDAVIEMPLQTTNSLRPVEPVPEPLPDSTEVNSATPEASLEEQLRLAADLSSPEASLATLFSMWGLEYAGAARPACEQAADLGYSCLYQRSTWAGLRQLDRPAMLTLVDRTGDDHSVVVTALEGDRAELSIGGISVWHPVTAVSELWFGQFMLLWKPPNGVAVSLRPGARDRNVLWLRQSLASIDPRYETAPLDSDFFDRDLEQKVRDFQRDNRLEVDGLAGQQTQIIINNLIALDGTPRLTTPRLARE